MFTALLLTTDRVQAVVFCYENGLVEPGTKAEVESVEIGDPVSVAMIRYSGTTGSVTVRSDWQEDGGRPVIVHAEPAG